MITTYLTTYSCPPGDGFGSVNQDYPDPKVIYGSTTLVVCISLKPSFEIPL